MQVRDDRGTRRRLRQAMSMVSLERAERARAWRQYAMYQRLADSKAHQLGQRVLLMALALAVGIVGVMRIEEVVGRILAPLALTLCGAAWLVPLQYAKARDRWRARIHARFSPVCPCCEYDLAGLEREDDGCVVCSECGAAWRVST